MCKIRRYIPIGLLFLVEEREEGKEKKFGDLVSKHEQAEAKGAVYHLNNIISSSKDDWKASAWILERRHNYTRYNHIEKQMQQQKPVSTDPKQIFKDQISELKKASEKALAMGSFQAYASLQRQQISAVMQLRQVESEDIDITESATDDALLYEISSMILSLPPIMRQRLESELNVFRSPNVVSIHKGKK